MTKKWIKVNDLSGGQYSINNNIRLKTPMLRSDLCDFIDALIFLRRTRNLKTVANNGMPLKGVAFKNNAPFISHISLINNAFINDAEHLDIFMLMNLLEYRDNHFMISESLWNY